jgi:hypothetical protein
MSPLFDQRSSRNFEIRKVFTAHQLFTILKEASHTVVIVEHNPTLFDGAETMIPQIAGTLKEVGHESLVILYAPSIDHTFSLLMRHTDHIIEIAPAEDTAGTALYRSSCTPHNGGTLPYVRRILEVS